MNTISAAAVRCTNWRLSPRGAFELLPAGNRRFVSGTPEHPNQDAVGRVEPGQVVAEHVCRTVDLLLERSRVPAERVDAGRTAVVDLCYRLADGSAHVVAARGLEHVPTT